MTPAQPLISYASNQLGADRAAPVVARDQASHLAPRLDRAARGSKPLLAPASTPAPAPAPLGAPTSRR